MRAPGTTPGPLLLMNRKLNRKLALGLLVAFAVVGGGVHVLHEFQVRANSRAWLAQSRRAAEQGGSARSINYLGLYLAHHPDDDDALAEYALRFDQVAATPRTRAEALAALE